MTKQTTDQVALNEALLKAIEENNSDQVTQLLAEGADVNAQDEHEATALNSATRKNHKEIARLLLSYGASINSKDCFDYTPLHGAVDAGNKALVKILAAYGANIDVEDNRGRTPLWAAIYSGHKEIVEALLQHNAGWGINKPNKDNKTPLDLAQELGNDEIIKLLKDYAEILNYDDEAHDD
jgi:ankyrin repeat protein